jgi:hypothetical protein
MYLPIIALSAHGVRVKVQLNAFSQVVNCVVSGTATDVTTIANGSGAIPGQAWSGWATGYDGQINDVSLTVRMVFLDQFERNLVSAEVHELLTLQHQEDFFATSISGASGTATAASNFSTILSFNNAIMAMFVVYQLTSATNSNNFAEKDFFNFGVLRPGMGLTTAPFDEQPPAIAAGLAATGLTKTPIAAWRLTFNGQDRVALRESEYFTQVTPFLHSVKKSYDLSVLSYYWHLAPLSDYQVGYIHAHVLISITHIHIFRCTLARPTFRACTRSSRRASLRSRASRRRATSRRPLPPPTPTTLRARRSSCRSVVRPATTLAPARLGTL